MGEKKFDTFFWLHIKKAGGISTRNLLKPYYKEVDRVKKPMNFIQAEPEAYNDIINNYRIVLGEFQFKRILFAKKFLFPQEWDSIFSFAFSREPIDRCISMFYYMNYNKNFLSRILSDIKSIKYRRKIGFSTSYDFDIFLDLIEFAHLKSDSIYTPSGLHFTTHTAPMFGDITDMDGNILIKRIYRIEDLVFGVNEVFKKCGIDHKIDPENEVYFNKTLKRKKFIPSAEQKIKISKIYREDFRLYEDASKSHCET